MQCASAARRETECHWPTHKGHEPKSWSIRASFVQAGQNQVETQRLTGVSQVDGQEKRHRAQDCGKSMCKSPEARKEKATGDRHTLK